MAERRAMTDEEFEAMYVQATEAGRVADATEPRAVAARYDRVAGVLTVEMKSGAVVTFPVRLVRWLAGASADELARVEVSPSGGGLHWEGLDMHLSVPGLLMEVLGSKAWLKQIQSLFARQAGSARTPAKARAARANGKKGGRPRKRAAS